MIKSQKTTIVVSKKTKSQLQKLGKIGDSFDSVIISLLAHSDKCDSFWSDRI
jgi:transcriptional regulator